MEERERNREKKEERRKKTNKTMNIIFPAVTCSYCAVLHGEGQSNAVKQTLVVKDEALAKWLVMVDLCKES